MGFSHLWSHVDFGSALSLKTSLSSFALILNRFSCQLASIWSYAAPIASIIIKFSWNELSLLDKVYAHVCEINQLADSFYIRKVICDSQKSELCYKLTNELCGTVRSFLMELWLTAEGECLQLFCIPGLWEHYSSCLHSLWSQTSLTSLW